MKSRVSFPKILFACAAGCVLTACGGDDNKTDPQPNPSPAANQYVGRWASECVTLGSVPGGPDQAGPIELRMSASRTSLPQNISNVPSSIGGPFTSQVTVEAITRNGSRYVPVNNAEGFFTCSVIQGIDSVSLYYHDGDDEHYHEEETGEVDPITGEKIKVKVENSYRTIAGDAGAGVFTFHVASDNKAGTAVVRCSATDPQSQKAAAAELVITVGSNSQLPTSIRVRDSNSNDYNASPRSPLNTMNPLSVQVSVIDETGNPAPDPAGNAANLIAEILPSSTAAGSTLRVGGQSGQRVMVRTIHGIAQVTIQAGNVPGALNVLFTGDALDNNVSNGVSLPIVQSIAVPVVDASVVADLQVLGITPQQAVVGKAYAGAVEVLGGHAGSPIGFTLVSGTLPPGLSLATGSGAINGTPTTAGTYNFTVGAAQNVNPATAGVAVSAQANVTISVSNSGLSSLYAATMKQIKQGQTAARSMRYEMEFAQHGSGKDLLVRKERAEVFADANCKQSMAANESKNSVVMTWRSVQPVTLNGRQVQADAFVVNGHHWRWLYKEGETLWARAAELNELGLGFVAFQRKK